VARLVDPEGRAQQIARQVRTQIEAGVLRDGQALPSTREMAREWDTSLTTVSSAIRILEAEGLVVSRDRAGRTVRAPGQAVRQGRPPVPQAVLIGGYAGSGKSELGRIIARATGWAMLDKDTLTRPVVEAALEMLGQSPDDRESDTYLRVVRPAEYAALAAAMTENLEVGTSCVVTAPFLREFTSRAWLDRTAAACQAQGAAVTVVWIRCDADSMRSYLRHRGAARDRWKLTQWDEYLSGVDLEFVPPFEHELVDNSSGSRPLQDQAAEILQRISKGTPAGA
jgi:predicted kinase